jgi:hypothetical protein
MRERAEKLAERMVGTNFSVVDLIEHAFTQIRERTLDEAWEIANNWRVFYKAMQDKSAPGEKDGMYRMFAAEDIQKEILKLKGKP